MRVMTYFKENDDEQITVMDLCRKMKEYLHGDTPYSERYMRRKIESHFGEEAIITCIRGKENVITLRSNAEKILEKFAKSKREKDTEKEKNRIIQTAAKLLLSDIKNLDTSTTEYPSAAEVSNITDNLDYLPSSLDLFLRTLLGRKKDPDLKIAPLGQALMQAARPTVLIPPLQIALGVAMHQQTGSKDLVERVHKLGFCSSYKEVSLFEMCATADQGTDLVGVNPNSWIQFVADNVDHPIRTLDGTGTFHGMGIIGAATPGYKQCKAVHRNLSISPETMSAIGRVPIRYFGNSAANLSLAYEVLQDFDVEDKTRPLDLLWKVSWPLRSPRPGWSGMMQAVCSGNYPGQSSFTFLPIIDMDPTNMSCIFSTLHFVSSLASRYNCTPVLTFDQPLWWKAMIIVDNEPINSILHSIILCLGGFHCQMSYLGCIGKLMAGSGLEQVLEVVYAQNSITHMLSGKSVSRAVRGHFLVDSVLNALVLSGAFNITMDIPDLAGTEKTERASPSRTSPIDDNSSEEMNEVRVGKETSNDSLSTHPSVCAVLSLYDRVISRDQSVDELDEKDIALIESVESKLLETQTHLEKGSLSRLWIQYMRLVDILRQFVKAERTGNWMLHLHALYRMLPYLAAAGHFQYTKSVHLYLQQMQQLKDHHPDVYNAFQNGYHVLRRSDRYWAGLSSDLVIEQVLMRSVKSAGGLTRGRGMADSQRTRWLLSMPACADMSNALQEVTGLEYCTSQQHVEAGESRKMRDDKDMKAIWNYLLDRNPFVGDQSLRNISTGVTADPSVNVDKADAIGNAILESMHGVAVRDFKFTKKHQAVTMNIKACTKVDDESIQVDPQLLFQRLVTAASEQAQDWDIPSIFQFELASPPPSIFDRTGLLREANKSALADAILTAVKEDPPDEKNEEEEEKTVLDGGSLLHKIPWRKHDTFSTIVSNYVTFVCDCYKSPTVVFDGYECGPSTKDTAHLRRSAGIVGPTVQFTGDTLLTSKKEVFLSNSTNKQKFINLLSKELISRGVHVLHAKGDADTLIVKTALERAATHQTTVIGEDTDLLVLLFHYSKQSKKDIFIRSGKKTKPEKRECNIRWLADNLGQEICQLLPFVHAVNGCDSTSRLFGIGKSVPLKKMSDPKFKTQAHIFCTPEMSQDTIISAGEKALVCLYSGWMEGTLDALRYQRFIQKVSLCATSVQIQSLPPTSAAARYHSLRVYLQVQEWINPSSNLDPQLWGWQLESGRLEPRQTDLPPAPEDLLKVIRCSCTKDCSSKRCTCRRHGLQCSVACGQCRGLSCLNAPTPQEEDEFDSPDVPDIY